MSTHPKRSSKVKHDISTPSRLLLQNNSRSPAFYRTLEAPTPYTHTLMRLHEFTKDIYLPPIHHLSRSVSLPRLLPLGGGNLRFLPFKDGVWYFFYVRDGLAGGYKLDYLTKSGRIRGGRWRWCRAGGGGGGCGAMKKGRGRVRESGDGVGVGFSW